MSDLPRGWATATIPELIGSEGVFVDGDWVESKDQDPDGDVRLVQLADVGDGAYLDKSNRFLTSRKATELRCTFIKRGDVLIARMPDPLGRACIFPGDTKKAVTVVDVCIVRGHPEHFESNWLMHFVNAAPFRASIHSLQSGSTRKRISRGNLSTLRLPVPPRAEQTRIVAKLEELLSDLDAGVAELKAAQKKLQQYRQSLLKAAVEGALTADWREAQRQQGTPTETGVQLLARILTERRVRWEARQLAKFKEQGKAPPTDWQKKYPEPERPDGTKMPSLPEGWTWTSVDQLSPDDLANGRSVPSAEGGAKVLRLTAVRNGLIDLNEVKSGEWTQDEAKPFAVEKGDLLIVRGNGTKSLVGRAGLVGSVNEQVAYPDTLIRLRVCEAVVSSRWVALVWDSEIVRSHLERRARTSAGIYKISQPDIVSARIPVPPIKEAIQAIDRLESQLELVADLERTVGKLLQQSSGQRQNVLRCAFAGHLVPQDPNAEPASVLVARIRAERAGCASQTRARKTKKYAEA